MTDPKIEQIGEHLTLGEGPFWDAQNQCLYYVDIKGHAFHKYVPGSETFTKCTLPGGMVSLVVPLEGTTDKFVVGHDRKIIIVTWDGKSPAPSAVEQICEVDNEDDKKTNRFNDGKCDPSGRLYAGTMGYEPKIGQIEKGKGSLYLIDLKNKTAKLLVDKITIANGLAWNLAKKKMYYIDTLTHGVDQFDYDAATGNISNRQTIFDFKKNSIVGIPDGMTIDNEGMLWVACFSGGRIIRIDPDTNRLLKTIPFPALQTTAMAFGGPDLDVLYVTSAALETEAKNPKAGFLYRVTKLGIKGAPGDKAKLL